MEIQSRFKGKSQMTKFPLGKSFNNGQPGRIKEMNIDQEFEHDHYEQPIKYLPNGFTIKMTAVISP